MHDVGMGFYLSSQTIGRRLHLLSVKSSPQCTDGFQLDYFQHTTNCWTRNLEVRNRIFHCWHGIRYRKFPVISSEVEAVYYVNQLQKPFHKRINKVWFMTVLFHSSFLCICLLKGHIRFATNLQRIYVRAMSSIDRGYPTSGLQNGYMYCTCTCVCPHTERSLKGFITANIQSGQKSQSYF